MREYHKINSVYKRDERGKFLIGEWSEPEFEYLKDNPWLWTEKIDGTNIRVMYDDNRPDMEAHYVTFGGKTDNAQIPSKLVQHLREIFDDGLLANIFGNSPACLYGEGYGAGIQKGGGNYGPDQKFILFDVKIGDWWLQRKDVEDIAAKLDIPVVPLFKVETISLNTMIDYVRSGTGIDAIPTSSLNANAAVEGWVGTPLVPLFNRKSQRIITKVKYKDFK
jgi:hypothetical protein